MKGKLCFYGPCYTVSPTPVEFVAAYLINAHDSLRKRNVKVREVTIVGIEVDVTPPRHTIQTALKVRLSGDHIEHTALYELPLGDRIDTKVEGKSHLQRLLEAAAAETYERYRNR